ncbi:MAG: hypothetical protein LBH07_08700 [Treponema sp.]|jgi:hypothetical protein|nr:hypothetical protein [Treponema sp.]
MTITQTVDIPADHRLTIDVPREVPAGRAVLTFTPEPVDLPKCPICAKHSDPVTGELRFNAETAAAIREGRAMMRGEIPAKWYSSLEEMLEDLNKDDPDDLSADNLSPED